MQSTPSDEPNQNPLEGDASPAGDADVNGESQLSVPPEVSRWIQKDLTEASPQSPDVAENQPAEGDSNVQEHQVAIDAEIVEAEPVTVPPIVMDGVVDAVAIAPGTLPKFAVPAEAVAVEAVELPPSTRVGSPFATSTDSFEKPRTPEENYTARGAAIASLVLGILCLATSWMSLLSVFPAMLGVMMGAWGLISIYRRPATIGFGLSALGILVSLGLALVRSG